MTGAIKHIVIWFKRDLRISDHEPIRHAYNLFEIFKKNNQACFITPLFIVEPELHKQADYSQKHWACTVDSLHDLHHELEQLESSLVIRTGDAVHIIKAINPTHMFSTQETGNYWTFKRDIAVKKMCQSMQIRWEECCNAGIVRALKSRDDWQSIHKKRFDREAIKTPSKLPFSNIQSEPLPTRFSSVQYPTGRKAAERDLNSFLLSRSSNYRYSLSRPWLAQTYSSRLSMHLAYGALSVFEVFSAIKAAVPSTPKHAQGIRAMQSRLYWRDHFIQKLEIEPSIEFDCMHPLMEGMRDINNQRYLEQWYLGKTGFPLVDACMRCLHQTGWLNFRMRAMVVSFAVYHLWLDWRVIHPLLAQLFADYEPGIHFSQLQMQSGVTGINAIRMYNPIKQSYEKDTEAKFIKHYVPELQHLSSHEVHEPWLFSDYIRPIVELEAAKQFARRKLSEFRQQPEFTMHAKQVFSQLGSRKRRARKSASHTKSRTSHSKQLSLFD